MSRKQGLPERGREAPYLYGDLTAEADMGGLQPHASISGRIPIKIDVAPAPPRRPPQSFMGMRPPAIATGRRQGNACTRTMVVEAAA
jgi:hypothetical protein